MLKWKLKRKTMDIVKFSSEISIGCVGAVIVNPPSHWRSFVLWEWTARIALFLTEQYLHWFKYWSPLSSRNNTKTSSFEGECREATFSLAVLKLLHLAEELKVWASFSNPPLQHLSLVLTCFLCFIAESHETISAHAASLNNLNCGVAVIALLIFSARCWAVSPTAAHGGNFTP